MSSFYNAYVTCALWSSTGDDGEPLDGTYDVDNLADQTQLGMRQDCIAFQELAKAELEIAYASDVYIEGEQYNASNAGIDFWLTRNGHGAGFWDRGLPNGDKLSELAKTFSSVDLYVGDDGLIYQA